MEVSGQPRGPLALPPGKGSRYPLDGRLGGCQSRSGRCPFREESPGHSPHNPSVYRQSGPDPQWVKVRIEKEKSPTEGMENVYMKVWNQYIIINVITALLPSIISDCTLRPKEPGWTADGWEIKFR
jgi:hypothetical protein